MIRRAKAVWAISLVIALTIVGRAAWIQVKGDPRLASLSKRQFQSKVLVRPQRGVITDRNGEPLAINIETKSLAVNPLKSQNRKLISRLLSKALDMPQQKILDRLKEKKEFAWIKRHLTDEELKRLKHHNIFDVNDDLMPGSGLWIVKESRRVYPHHELAAHVVGDVNLDNEGLEGAELWKNESLEGKVTSVSAVRDALGRPAFIDAVEASNIKDGDPLQLSIDVSLQYSVEHELANAVEQTGSKGGVVIVMDSTNGEILALANLPGFDANVRGGDPSKRRNRAFTDGFEPGSTIKPILLASALSHGWRLGDRLYGEHGSFEVQGRRISEAEVHERFEWLSIKDMVRLSSNVVAAKLAMRLGADKYLSALQSFGFGAKSESGFPGEISGKLQPRRAIKPLTLANMGFGQGLLVTPIQMTRAYAALANGGWLVTPTLIKRPPNADNAQVAQSNMKHILTPKAADGAVEAMRGVTEQGGTGTKARLEGYDVAGKTGTAQLVDSQTGKYARHRYNSSFIGFAVGVEPKLVIFTMLQEPTGAYYAGETAAPLFSKILQVTTHRYSMPAHPQIMKTLVKNIVDPIKISQSAPEPLSSEMTGQKLLWQGHKPDGSLLWKMPKLDGLSLRESLRVFHGHHFKIDIKGEGVVIRQSPEIGSSLAEGDTVRLELNEP